MTQCHRSWRLLLKCEQERGYATRGGKFVTKSAGRERILKRADGDSEFLLDGKPHRDSRISWSGNDIEKASVWIRSPTRESEILDEGLVYELAARAEMTVK